MLIDPNARAPNTNVTSNQQHIIRLTFKPLFTIIKNVFSSNANFFPTNQKNLKESIV